VPEGPTSVRSIGPLTVVVVGLTVVVVDLAVVLVGPAVLDVPWEAEVVVESTVVSVASVIVVTAPVTGGDVVTPDCSCWILSCSERVLIVTDPVVVLLAWPPSLDAVLEVGFGEDSSLPAQAVTPVTSMTKRAAATRYPNLGYRLEENPTCFPCPRPLARPARKPGFD
jgi:hypothetical protein